MILRRKNHGSLSADGRKVDGRLFSGLLDSRQLRSLSRRFGGIHLVSFMKPQISSLPSAARLSARPLNLPLSYRGVCHYAQIASVRARPSLSQSNRLVWLADGRQVQRRWITLAYIQRMKDAEKQWKEWAQEIKAGKRLSFVQHLEQRELLHDVVGCVVHAIIVIYWLGLGPMLTLGFFQRTRPFTQSLHREASRPVRRCRSNRSFVAYWTHVAVHGFSVGLRLGLTRGVLGQ